MAGALTEKVNSQRHSTTPRRASLEWTMFTATVQHHFRPQLTHIGWFEISRCITIAFFLPNSACNYDWFFFINPPRIKQIFEQCSNHLLTIRAMNKTHFRICLVFSSIMIQHFYLLFFVIPWFFVLIVVAVFLLEIFKYYFSNIGICRRLKSDDFVIFANMLNNSHSLDHQYSF